MRLISFISLIIILLTPVIPEYAAAKTESEKIKLDNIKSKIIEREKKLKEYKKKEGQVIERLNRLEQQLLKDNIKVEEINEKISQIKKSIKESRKLIDELNNEIAEVKDILDKRLISLYKYHNRSGLRILLSSDTYNDFLRHDKLLNKIVSNDYNLIKKSLKRIEEKVAHEKKLKNQKSALLKQKKKYYKSSTKIEVTKKEKISLLKKTREKKAVQLTAIKELKEYARKLQDFIDRLPEEKKDFKSLTRRFSAMKGKLPFPVKGKIITKFGRKEHVDLHTFTFEKGIDIKAPQGKEVQSIFEGKVIYADWFKGYGKMMIINHGEKYYSLFGHASKLFKKTGDIVGQGETIALVGDTNSLKGSCLYFEIRHHGKPQDPLRWLVKAGNK